MYRCHALENATRTQKTVDKMCEICFGEVFNPNGMVIKRSTWRVCHSTFGTLAQSNA